MSLFTHGCVELLTECCCVSLSDSGGRRHWTPSWENNQDWITARIKRAKPHQLARPSAPPSRALIIRAKPKQKRSERTANARLLCQPAGLFQNTSGFQITEEIPPTARDKSGCSFARLPVSQKRRTNHHPCFNGNSFNNTNITLANLRMNTWCKYLYCNRMDSISCYFVDNNIDIKAVWTSANFSKQVFMNLSLWKSMNAT